MTNTELVLDILEKANGAVTRDFIVAHCELDDIEVMDALDELELDKRIRAQFNNVEWVYRITQ